MHISSTSVVAALALLSGSVAGFGLLRSDLTRKFQLYAELGLDANLLLHDRESFRTIGRQGNIPAETVEIPIDHDDPSFGTYQNRYWVNEAYYIPRGPIMVFDGGEVNGEYSLSHLTSSTSFFRSLLQEFNAIGIVWEHRYYGASLPYPISNNTPPEHWKYLTTRQALADIPYFAGSFTRPAYPDSDLTPESAPWVMVGGSYAGIRAALTRSEYPDTIFASFASSAPVQAKIDMSSFFDQVYRGMVANGCRNCAQDIHAALEYIDEQLSQEDTAISVKQLFFGSGAEQNSNEDFTAALAGLFGYYQTYGMGGSTGSLGDFCRYLESDPETGVSAGPEGLAPSRGSQYLAERWASWPDFIEVVNFNMYTNCRGLNSSVAPSCELNKPPTEADMIAWSWQYCSEWGFYQSENRGTHSLLSRYQTLGFQQALCNRIFSEAADSGVLPSEPQADSVNEEFGGWSIRPSNVYFSAGEFDPWRTLSLFSTEDFAPQGVRVTTEIPQCGVQTDEATVFGYVGSNQHHTFDFVALNEVGAESRGYFIQALKKWLPCFGKQTDTT
ncbi:serine carboxypeptidase S28-domain-containing protein [Aspergillus cavernicola]|uniref:Serine carboxypeptidase S28-domain-containing protein n=1 Tax=Aspergillus cavernicola TaxID=176166 RepID=A0ABR4J041_9EURO